MNTKNDRDQHVKQYLINCIDLEPYELDHLTDTGERILAVHSIFTSEKGDDIAINGEQKALENWFRGLPTAMNTAFMNHEIIQLATDWGYISDTMTENAKDKFAMERYWRMLAAKFLQLVREYQKPPAPAKPARGPLCPKHWKSASSLKSVRIHAKEWFDRVNGNSYCSARVYVNENLKNAFEFGVGFQYGYGNYAEQRALEILREQGISLACGWSALRDQGVTVKFHKESNCRKADVKAHAGTDSIY